MINFCCKYIIQPIPEKIDLVDTPKPFSQDLTINRNQGFLLGNQVIVGYRWESSDRLDFDPKPRSFLTVTAPVETLIFQEKYLYSETKKNFKPPNYIGTRWLLLNRRSASGRDITYIGADFVMLFVRGDEKKGDFILLSAQECRPVEIPTDVRFVEYLRNLRHDQSS